MTDQVDILSVAEAQRVILTRIQPCGVELATLLQSLGCVLAEDVLAQDDLPPFYNSGMDGYAVRADDVQDAGRNSPVTLSVVADIAAGHPSDVTVGPGQAARIMTGAPVPAGADAVVPVEATDGGGASSARVAIFQKAKRGEHVRPAGVMRGAATGF
jgi:molybdopterin molybdotransferase